MSLISLFVAGGPVMWPLAACSIVALAIVIERSLNLRVARVLEPAVVERLVALAEGRRADAALQFCRERPAVFTNIVRAGLELVAQGESVYRAQEAVEDAGRHESVRIGRYLGLLGTVVGVAPLLGLLGTVTGMIDVFNTIAKSGTGHAADLSSGIAEALITTAAGLIIAIPAQVAHHVFQERADAIVTELERESLRVLRSFGLGEVWAGPRAARPELAVRED